jgi:hypothetical protein
VPSYRELPLFGGDHVAAFRYERALDALDFAAAREDAPEAELPLVRGLMSARSVPEIAGLRPQNEASPLHRAWCRRLARALDRTRMGLHDGLPAAAWHLLVHATAFRRYLDRRAG